MLSFIAHPKAFVAMLTTLAVLLTQAPLAQAQPIAAQTHAPRLIMQPVSSTSRNWAGYVAQNGPYTTVSGTWTVPSVTGSYATSADAAWIGIGGMSSSDLIQSGTQDIVDPDGQVSTSGFYELLPDAAITIPTVTVHPGDSVTVSIARQQLNRWQISFTDTTDRQTFKTTVAYTSSLSSAEWIEEAPSDGSGTMPLANFGSVSFKHGASNHGTIAKSGAQSLTMADDQGQTLATPSALSSDGASFTVSDQQASSDGGSPVGSWWGDTSGSGQGSW
jgi:hypothetical protein